MMSMVDVPGFGAAAEMLLGGIEHHVEWICDCLVYLRQHGRRSIEATREAQDEWVEHVNEAANRTLFPLANSWFLGANIPGKPRVFMPYVAKIGLYRKECQDIADQGYAGFTLAPERQSEQEPR